MYNNLFKKGGSYTHVTFLTILLMSFFFVECSKNIELERQIIDDTFDICVKTDVPKTKTAIIEGETQSEFEWKDKDEIGLIVCNIQSNVELICKNQEEGTFRGSVKVRHETETDVTYGAYYPFSACESPTSNCITATLPHQQDQSNPMQYDYMVATPLEHQNFDEFNMPELTFHFDNHLFSIVKLNVTATTDDYNGEKIHYIGLRSSNEVISGTFSFNPLTPAGGVSFSSDPLLAHKVALSVYPAKTQPTIQRDNTFSVYVIVKSGNYAANTLSIEVKTDAHLFTIPCAKDINLQRNRLTAFSVVDICKNTATVKDAIKKTIVLWGDSLTHPEGWSNYLQTILGSGWNVVNAGVGSDPAYVIAGRQGGYPVYTQNSAFTLPKNPSDIVENEGLFVSYSRNNEVRYDQFLYIRSHEFPKKCLINPIILKGYYKDDNGIEHEEDVQCEVDYLTSEGWDYTPTSVGVRNIHRITEGEYDLTIKPRTRISTYGSRVYNNSDVILVYLGANDNNKTTEEYNNYIINSQDCMLSYIRAQNPDAIMIVCGFHVNPDKFPKYWTQEYVNALSSHFGVYFIDQRTVASNNAVRYMIELGMIKSRDDISSENWNYIQQGNWPKEFGTDLHPGTYGYYARALMARDKMKELGLID